MPAGIAKMLAASIPKKSKNAGPSCGGSGSGAGSCNHGGAPKNPGQEPAGMGHHGGSKKFSAPDLSGSVLRAVLYECFNEGLCDTGPVHAGQGKIPKGLTTKDMLETYDYACKKNDFRLCDEKAGTPAPAPEPVKVNNNVAAPAKGDTVDSAYKNWCKANPGSCSLVLLL